MGLEWTKECGQAPIPPGQTEGREEGIGHGYKKEKKNESFPCNSSLFSLMSMHKNSFKIIQTLF